MPNLLAPVSMLTPRAISKQAVGVLGICKRFGARILESSIGIP